MYTVNKTSNNNLERSEASNVPQKVIYDKKDLYEELNIDDAEPMIDGFWVIDRPLVQEGGIIFNCSACFSYFEDRISYELHMQGLKHKQNKKQCPSKGETRIGQSLKHFTKLETMLHESSDPMLGVDYLTEFLHTNARYDCVCNLCGVECHTTQEARVHVTSSNHLLNFIYQHNRSLYNTLQLNKVDMYLLRDGAKKLQDDLNERNKRTKIMEELGNVWVEYQHDDDANSCKNLKGHQLNGQYEEPSPINSQQFVEQHSNNVDQLSNNVERLFILSNDLPPNYHIKNFNRTTFLDLLGRMTIKSNEDADLCLRLANSLTLSLLKYRMHSINNLKTVNADELKEKVKGLIEDATIVSHKLLHKQITVS